MIYLALRRHQNGGYIGVAEISHAIDSPKAFTSKVLQILSRAKMLDSLRGPTGGFCLPEDQNLTLADIVRVVDGDDLMDGCVLGFKECSADRPCPAHFKFQNVRDFLKGALLTTNLEEMRDMIIEGKGFLKF